MVHNLIVYMLTEDDFAINDSKYVFATSDDIIQDGW